MGYTHYWRQKETLNQGDWAMVLEDAKAILEKTDTPIACEYDEPNKPPQLDGEEIRLNGIGEDGGHETFCLTRKRREPRSYEQDEDTRDGMFEFCKTAQKPYDVVVTAILACVSDRFPAVFTVSSDGETEDWENGINLATVAVNRHIAVPQNVVQYT